MFICGWISINLGFSVISMFMSVEHKFRVENRNGNTQVVFYHPEHKEQESRNIHKHHHDLPALSKNSQPRHEHAFQLVSSDHQKLIPLKPILKIDSERAPPIILIAETFNFIPGEHSPYKYYKYPSGVNTTSLSLKTIVLLI